MDGFAAEGSASALAAFLLAALLYGILHAAGPGHRKTVVFSLFLGRRAAAWEPAAAGFLSAGIHAASGGFLIAVLSLARGALAGLGEAEAAGSWLDGLTFGLLVLASLGLAGAKLASIARGRAGAAAPEGPGAAGPGRAGRGLYGTVALASLVPCPGAVMLLLFAAYAGHPWLGAAGLLAMSLGMGLVVSASAYLAYCGREGLFRGLKARESTVGLVSELLELASYLLVLGFSLYMAWPFFAALFRAAS